AEGADSPVGKALPVQSGGAGLVVPRSALPTDDAHNIGEGDFTVAAWIHPGKLRKQGIVSLGNADRSQGWFLDMLETGWGSALGFQTAGREVTANATVTTPPGTISEGGWQHVAVVVRRGKNDTRIYVNGVLTARAATGSAQFDDTQADLQIGRIPAAG